jgi:hypothetical protein
MKIISFTMTLITEMLGMCLNDPEAWRKMLAERGATPEQIAEEIAALPTETIMEKLLGVYLRHPISGLPCLMDYHIRGAFKDACNFIAMIKGTAIASLPKYRRDMVVDGMIMVEPRFIPLIIPANSGIVIAEHAPIELPVCVRPLRGMTQSGPRVTLKASEMLPIGTSFSFDIKLLTNTVDGEKVKEPVLDSKGEQVYDKNDEPKMKNTKKPVLVEDCLREWMNYTELRGWGGWRNSGRGRTSYEVTGIKEWSANLGRPWTMSATVKEG